MTKLVHAENSAAIGENPLDNLHPGIVQENVSSGVSEETPISFPVGRLGLYDEWVTSGLQNWRT